MQIYLIPPFNVLIYNKRYCEGVYGEADFTIPQMEKLVELKCATWFDIASPHADCVPAANSRPNDYIGPISTTLRRVEIWGIDWFTLDLQKELREEYPVLSPVFQRDRDP